APRLALRERLRGGGARLHLGRRVLRGGDPGARAARARAPCRGQGGCAPARELRQREALLALRGRAVARGPRARARLPEDRAVRRAFWLASGVVVWALHFTAAYGYTGLACARGMAASVPWVVG